MSSARRPLVGGNWKMNLLRGEAASFCSDFVAASPDDSVEIVVFPPAPLLDTVAHGLTGSAVAWGGQDLHPLAIEDAYGKAAALEPPLRLAARAQEHLAHHVVEDTGVKT